MNPSAEVKDAMLRVYAAHSAGDADAALGLVSDCDGVTFIGSDPVE